jgi:hypothetical protein
VGGLAGVADTLKPLVVRRAQIGIARRSHGYFGC